MQQVVNTMAAMVDVPVTHLLVGNFRLVLLPLRKFLPYDRGCFAAMLNKRLNQK